MERGSRENSGVRQKRRFSLSGALFPVWRQIKNVKDASFKIVRTTRMKACGSSVCKCRNNGKEITRLFDCAWQRAETSKEIFQSVIGGKESIKLVEIFVLKTRNFSAIITSKSFRARRNTRKSSARLESRVSRKTAVSVFFCRWTSPMRSRCCKNSCRSFRRHAGTIFIDKVLDEKAVESGDAPPVERHRRRTRPRLTCASG